MSLAFRRVGPGGYGHVRESGHRYTPIRGSRLVRGLSLPPSASLVDHSPGVLDQGMTSSCVGHATVVAAFATLRAHGQPSVLGDPGECYRVGRAIDRIANTDGSFDPLTDQGSQPNQVIRGVQEFGVVPYVGPVSPATINDEPSLLELEVASVFRFSGAYSTLTPDDICAALVAGVALTFAFEVDDAFENYSGSGTLGAATGLPLGGHDVAILGYETGPSGRLFHVQNSWGTEWGSAGFALVDESFIARGFDVLALNVSKVT